MTAGPPEALQALGESAARLLRSTAARPGAPRSMVPLLLQALEQASFEGDPGPGSEGYAACAMLDGLLATAETGPLGDLLRALERARPALRWMQNASYKDDPLMQGYLRNSAFCELIGPRGPVGSELAAVGFLLIGPAIHYPSHSHPGEELYVVLCGDAEWQRDGEGWRARPPGSWVHHAPGQGHATRTRARPLLALYCLCGDLVTPARSLGAVAPSASI